MASRCFMFMYFLLPHWVPATCRRRAQTSMSTELPSGKRPATRVRPRIFQFSRCATYSTLSNPEINYLSFAYLGCQRKFHTNCNAARARFSLANDPIHIRGGLRCKYGWTDREENGNMKLKVSGFIKERSVFQNLIFQC